MDAHLEFVGVGVVDLDDLAGLVLREEVAAERVLVEVEEGRGFVVAVRAAEEGLLKVLAHMAV